MKRIVVLVSGRGSNMMAIVRACRAERWPAEVAVVIADRASAAGLAAAREAGIETAVVSSSAAASRDAFDAALAAEIDRHAPDLLLFAGFMRIVGEAFVRRYHGRLLNVHPSLLPAFTGLHTHRRVLAAGCKVTGATVHFVTPVLDEGPIVAQAVVPVLVGDDEDSLAARVLAAEHRLYPRAVRWFVEARLEIAADRVVQTAGETQALFCGGA